MGTRQAMKEENTQSYNQQEQKTAAGVVGSILTCAGEKYDQVKGAISSMSTNNQGPHEKSEGVHDEAKQRATADWETATDRGIAARSNIYGAMGTLTESIKEKLTYPTDIVHEARASREYGGPKRATKERLVDDDVDKGGPTGPAAMP